MADGQTYSNNNFNIGEIKKSESESRYAKIKTNNRNDESFHCAKPRSATEPYVVTNPFIMQDDTASPKIIYPKRKQVAVIRADVEAIDK